MSNLGALKRYAQMTDLAGLPASVLFSHTASSLTVFDAYPKAKFHFLVMPRILSGTMSSEERNDMSSLPEPPNAPHLHNLRTLLKIDKSRSKELLVALREDAVKVKESIEEEMATHYGFKWPVWMGFHAVPSMEHVHLHVMSADLISPTLKHKKHYNSFHPSLGFFLHMDDVLSWFDADDSFFNQKAALREKEYEPLLKTELSCFVCDQSFKTIPKLKEHLQQEWDKRAKKVKASGHVSEQKRKREEHTDDAATAPDPKRREGEESEH